MKCFQSQRIVQMNNYFTHYSTLRRTCLLFIGSVSLLGSIFHCSRSIYSPNRSLQDSLQSQPIILLFTHNHSAKTRENICRGTRNGGHVVHFQSCPKKCEFSCRIEDFHQRSPAALLFFGEDFSWSFKLSDRNRTSTQQRWIFWSWEAPIHHPEYTKSNLTFNWFAISLVSTMFLLISFRTMTYRADSDIVHNYGRYIAHNQSKGIRDRQSIDGYLSSTGNQSTFDSKREFSLRQNRILWFVSNCQARSRRNDLAAQIKLLYPVDQYGRCSQSNQTGSFEGMLVQYKFYLAFESTHCEDYITEKTFYNSLAHGSIPIVLGPTEENTRKLLPPHSFLHVDHFKTTKELVDTLHRIGHNPDEFSSYHRWRDVYRVLTWKSNYFLDDRFCDLCIKLHEDRQPKVYSNFSAWLNRCH